ncbi:MAG: STAS domain-containing protein [Treponema sp.]|nr:STAS domain-containing protein [Treponema sp.]
MEQLAITEREGANYTLYELKGGLNAYTLGDFEGKLYEIVKSKNVVLDMSGLIELDSSGLGLLMTAFNDSVEAGNKLFFLSMSNESSRALAETGFKSDFYVINSVTEAV